MSSYNDGNGYLLTLRSVESGDDTTFWLEGKTEKVAVAKAKRLMKTPCSVIEVQICTGSPLKRKKASDA
jgi:hypothetical protein